MKLGPVEAQLRAMREAQFAERQRQVRKPAAVSRPETPRSETETAQPVINAVINPGERALLTATNARRQSKWRTAHIDLNRQRAREGMRRLRAERRKAAA
jgi:hypothetical protein